MDPPKNNLPSEAERERSARIDELMAGAVPTHDLLRRYVPGCSDLIPRLPEWANDQ